MTATRPRKLHTQDMARIALFSALLAVCAWTSIPGPVPFTLQSFGVFLSVLVLGGRSAMLSILLYLLLGLVGLPVFAGFAGGIGHLLGATGGFLLGFLWIPPVCLVLEPLTRTRKYLRPMGLILGQLTCYLFGTLWFLILYSGTPNGMAFDTAKLSYALSICVLPYLLPDGIKLVLALWIGKRLAIQLRR